MVQKSRVCEIEIILPTDIIARDRREHEFVYVFVLNAHDLIGVKRFQFRIVKTPKILVWIQINGSKKVQKFVSDHSWFFACNDAKFYLIVVVNVKCR